MGGFLDYISGDSFLHKLNPLTKFASAFLLCIACFVSNQVFFVLGIIVLTLALSLISGLTKRCLICLKALSKLSIIVFIVQVLFVPQGNVYFYLPFGVAITDIGVEFSLLFALRLLASTLPLIIMLSITQMSDLANVLVEKVGIPYKYTFALTTAVRFIPIFSSEMSDIMEAQIARGVEFDTKNPLKKISLLLPLCVPLLISSVKKVNSGALSASLRGFNYRQRGFGYKTYNFKTIDIITTIISVLIVIFSAFCRF
ncbi:MAG: energy-coupling factor transporter transmembrane component T [Clostridia bacterium]